MIIKLNILIKSLFLLCLAVSSATAVLAQATATATASATIVTPISIVKNVDMNFGNIAVGGSDGTVILSPESIRTPKGGVTLPRIIGEVAAASFSVSGLPNSTYSITLPASAISLNYLTKTMMATEFTSTPSAIGTLIGGRQIVTIGATLNVGAAQMEGSYASLSFPVTVNYN